MTAEAKDPTALALADAALLLSKVGGRRVNETTLAEDVERGAPTNADGTINLVHYASWLVREMAYDGSRTTRSRRTDERSDGDRR